MITTIVLSVEFDGNERFIICIFFYSNTHTHFLYRTQCNTINDSSILSRKKIQVLYWLKNNKWCIVENSKREACLVHFEHARKKNAARIRESLDIWRRVRVSDHRFLSFKVHPDRSKSRWCKKISDLEIRENTTADDVVATEKNESDGAESRSRS